MKHSFLLKLRQMVADLQQCQGIQVAKADFAPPAMPHEIEAIQRLVGGSLPEDLVNFFEEMNGFRLEWSYIPDKKKKEVENIRGVIEILPVQEVFKDWKGVIWYDEFEGGDRFKGVKPFDFFAEEACTSLVYTSKKELQPTIYYHYLGEFLCNTGYSFTEYMDRLIAAKGFFYWIETLCLDTAESPQALAFFKQMPLLFKDFQPSLFQPKAIE